ncbi:MAG: transposase, partial [Geminicoccaceae bacterium]
RPRSSRTGSTALRSMVDILIRGDSHYARPEAMSWLERNRVGYVFGLAGNRVLLARIRHLAEDAAVARVEGQAEDGKARRYGECRYAARTWPTERRVIARIEVSAHRPSADPPAGCQQS